MKELNFKHDLILVYLNEKGNAYDSYELMLILSINYDFLQSLFNELIHHELIEKNKDILRYQVTSQGYERLREQSLSKFDLESFLKINREVHTNKKNFSFENIFYIPKDFKN